MFILFLTREPVVCRCIGNFIAKDNPSQKISFRIIKSIPEMLGVFRELGTDSIDLMVMDYTLTLHDGICIFDSLKDSSYLLPVVFYNDPCTSQEKFTEYWTRCLSLNFGSCVDRKRLEKAEALLPSIARLVYSKNFNPYVSVICRPRKMYEMDEASGVCENGFCFENEKEPSQKNEFEVKEDDSASRVYSENYSLAEGLPLSRRKLFEYLYQHKNESCSAKELCLHLWNACDEKAKRNLYAYIHDIRNYLDGIYSCFRLERSGKERYILIEEQDAEEQNIFID